MTSTPTPILPLWVTIAVDHRERVFAIAAVNPRREESYRLAKERMPPHCKFFCVDITSPDAGRVGLDVWLKKQGFKSKKARAAKIRELGRLLARMFDVE